MMTLIEALQQLTAEWHRRRADTLSALRPVEFLGHVSARASAGHEPALRLLRAEGLPPADVKPRPIGTRSGTGGPDVDFLEYVEDMLEAQWQQDIEYCDWAPDLEAYWRNQNRLRRLLGIEELHESALTAVVKELQEAANEK